MYSDLKHGSNSDVVFRQAMRELKDIPDIDEPLNE